MKKLILLIILLIPIKVMGISAESAVVMDSNSGRVLYCHNCDKQKLIASTTKIMTSIIAIEYGDLNKRINAEEEILEDSMQIYLLDVEKGVCYTEDTSKIVQFCHMLMAETEEELRKYTKGVFDNMEVEEKLINNDLAISMDTDDYSMTFDLSEEELDRNSRIREAREEGEAIGLEKGEVRKQNEIAKAMLKEKMDKSLIARITKLPLSKIMML